MTGYGYEGYSHSTQPASPSQGSEEDYEDYDNRRQEWMDARKIIHPQPGQFKPPGQRFNEEYDYVNYEDLPTVDLRKDFGRLQIIVKLATIYLSPEKPAYDGGSWHVEGQLNENMLVL